MSVTKDWKTYYTTSEVKEKLQASVRVKAKNMAKKIENEINSKEQIHV